ncbi:hypothetical protein HYW74_01680 [Candidatus Pacearchaeota archaeon]|nr:hypothetical protein [Candidatus Pacearchaeota archaeon]
MNDNVVYSKIEYQDALFAKKHILETQINLLNAMNSIDNYKDLRKKELLLKLKLKNNLKNIKDHIIKLNNHLPQTKEMKKHISVKNIKGYERGYEDKESKKKRERASSIESELEDIRNKLSQLG